MALEVINTGTAANSGDGDNLRAFATKAKNNFAEIYADDFVTSARIADDVALGGNPTTTTQAAGDNSTKIATTAYADTAVANAIDAAPAALDTLNELAASLNDDADFAGTMTTSLAGKLSTDAGAVGTSNLADSAVTTAKIADANVTTAKITDANVTTAKIADSAVTTAKIAADAVDGTKIADDSIDSEHYVDGSIDTAHIADSQITTAKIADDAVTIAKIADAAIVTEAEGIGSNDNDTTLPTSAAVKDYVDSAGIGVSVISTNTTATSGNLYVLTANLTLTLPASPSAGDYIKVSNRSGVATCTIARNSENIMGAASDLTLDKLNSGFELIYSGSAQGWVLIGVEGA